MKKKIYSNFKLMITYLLGTSKIGTGPNYPNNNSDHSSRVQGLKVHMKNHLLVHLELRLASFQFCRLFVTLQPTVANCRMWVTTQAYSASREAVCLTRKLSLFLFCFQIPSYMIQIGSVHLYKTVEFIAFTLYNLHIMMTKLSRFVYNEVPGVFPLQ